MESNINISFLKEEYKKLLTKLEQISELKSCSKLWDGVGDDFDNITFNDDNTIGYHTSYWYHGGSCPDYYDFYIKEEDINKPIEWFDELFTKQYEEKMLLEKQKEEQNELKTKLELEAKERLEFERLSKKFS